MWEVSAHYHHQQITILTRQQNNPHGSRIPKQIDRWWAWGHAVKPNFGGFKPIHLLYEDTNKAKRRRASAVWMHLHYHNGNYFPLITMFRSQPDHDGEPDHNGLPTSWSMLAAFADSLTGHPDPNERYVKLFGDWSHW
jgi:hypothetical protein